ncbi:MAG: hypothetical protein WCQ90_08025 [Deltaproteobacteria bacterium]
MDRVTEWQEFSKRMEEYIENTTVEKYTKDGVDLMDLTGNPTICVWNIIRYAWRIWNNNMKLYDIEKIAHYAAMAWKLSEGKMIRTKDEEKLPIKVISSRRVAEF